MLDFMGSGSKLDSIQEKCDENERERYWLGVWNDLRLVDLNLFVGILVFAQFWIVLEEDFFLWRQNLDESHEI